MARNNLKKLQSLAEAAGKSLTAAKAKLDTLTAEIEALQAESLATASTTQPASKTAPEKTPRSRRSAKAAPGKEADAKPTKTPRSSRKAATAPKDAPAVKGDEKKSRRDKKEKTSKTSRKTRRADSADLSSDN